ncbi:MAG TPA: hypothetical protein VNN76_08610 [Bacteroidota bacterium]|nr:hypothetical protein [Bacteroidota bacterium]
MSCVAGTIKDRLLHRMGSRHVAGNSVDDALQAYEAFQHKGWGLTLSPWKRPEESPAEICAHYVQCLRRIAHLRLNAQLSIKPRDIAYDMDLLTRILDLASEENIMIQFDAQEPNGATLSFALLERALKLHSEVACTLPARWGRSRDDAEQAIQLGIPVRIVKGQWKAGGRGCSLRRCFRELVAQLAGRARKVLIATHDETLAAETIPVLGNAGTPFELEQLLGLPLIQVDGMSGQRIPRRVYIPYGFPSLPYRLRDFKERPAILFWMVRDLVGGNRYKVVV